MFVELGPALWVHPVSSRKLGVDARRQLVVVRLAAGELWIHPPAPVTAEPRAALAALGEVRQVVGPNWWHDEGLAEFQAAYPSAELHAAPGRAGLRRDVRFAHTLGDSPPPAWAGALEQLLVRGMPRMNEIVFFHRASRCLILAELALNLGPPGPAWERLLFSLAGAWGRFTPTHFCRSLMRDRAAVRTSLDQILAGDFDRIIVGHGRNLERDGRAALRTAFSFLT